MVFHGSRLVFHGFSWFWVGFHVFFMVPGWFFMVPGRFSWFFMVPVGFFMVPGRFSWFFMVPGQFSCFFCGPKSKLANSHWEEKVISSSSNIMVVEFKSDVAIHYPGFNATIHFTLLQNKKCESWMNTNNHTLISPNYPNSYGNDIFCNCLITVDSKSHIKLDFLEFDVSFLIIPI